jgi:hypothetical protein
MKQASRGTVFDPRCFVQDMRTCDVEFSLKVMKNGGLHVEHIENSPEATTGQVSEKDAGRRDSTRGH